LQDWQEMFCDETVLFMIGLCTSGKRHMLRLLDLECLTFNEVVSDLYWTSAFTSKTLALFCVLFLSLPTVGLTHNDLKSL
jgi:hypothetical protein